MQLRTIHKKTKNILITCLHDEQFRTSGIEDETLHEMLRHFQSIPSSDCSEREKKRRKTAMNKILDVFCEHRDLKKRLHRLCRVHQYDYVLRYFKMIVIF